MVPQEVVLFLTLEVVPKLTLERPKSGTKTNSPAYIYIYAVKLKTGPMFALFKVKNWSNFCCFFFLKISFSLQKEEDL